MIRRDYHGFKLHDALRDIEDMIDNIRMTGKSEDAEIITGFGQIRSGAFQKLLDYGLKPSYMLGNNGTILCLIE